MAPPAKVGALTRPRSQGRDRNFAGSDTISSPWPRGLLPNWNPAVCPWSFPERGISMSKYPDPFLDYLRVKFPPDGMIVPEPEDYRGWQAGSDSPDAEIARHYRLAQAK